MLKLINIYPFFSIISILILHLSFVLTNDFQNELDNNFVQYKLINLREFGNASILQDQLFTFDQPFETKPQIIFGIVHYQNQDKPAQQGINFHITCEQVNKNNCNLKLHLQDPPYILYNLKVIALAIDSQYIPNIKVSDLKVFYTNAFQKKENLLIHEIKIKYSTEIMRYEVKKVAVFLNGFKTSNYDEQKDKYMKIGIEVEQTEKEYFLIKVISKEESIKIEQIYIQWIEYGEDEESNFFAEMFQEKKFKDESFCNSSQSQCTRKEKVSEKIIYEFKTEVQNGSGERIFYGINQLDFTFGKPQKILLSVDTFIKQDLNLKYLIQNSEAIMNGIQSTFIIIGIRKCFANDFYYKKSCYSNCFQKGQNQEYYDVKYCGCKFDDYFEYGICQSINNVLCCSMVYFPYNTCFTNCQKYSNSKTCDICEDGYYVNKNKCCEKCDSSCNTCIGPSKLDCSSCKPFKYQLI